jgi:tripeptide aminopeptidase
MSDYRQFDKAVTERFLRYVRIWTASDTSLAGERKPTTGRQMDFLKMLDREFAEMGIGDRTLLPSGFLIARIPASGSGGDDIPGMGWMAHVDTSDDEPGENVQPVCHENYGGEVINLKDGVVISPEENPGLADYKGETVITADGRTLLGADDKAGVAEIMTAAEFLIRSGDWNHGEIELIFTCDEETGTGMDGFPVDMMNSGFCYTVDGGAEGEIESECYNAASAEVRFTGNVIHPGYGRGRFVNAVSMAANFIQMIPRNESPEATDGRFGNYWVHDISGRLSEAVCHVMIRDFEKSGLIRRKEALEEFAGAVKAAFPGGRVSLVFKDQYVNMKNVIDSRPEVMAGLVRAVRETGLEPYFKAIRGGTDGARLTELGIPCPNIFTGGHNFHSRREWIGVPAMSRVCQTLLNLTKYPLS